MKDKLKKKKLKKYAKNHCKTSSIKLSMWSGKTTNIPFIELHGTLSTILFQPWTNFYIHETQREICRLINNCAIATIEDTISGKLVNQILKRLNLYTPWKRYERFTMGWGNPAILHKKKKKV